jgi:chromosome segregation ATPase
VAENTSDTPGDRVIEHGLYFSLGFLSACMLVLLTLPLIWRRAYRLTRREIEATLPLSPAEIAAERDQIRAKHAVEKLQLEQNLDNLRAERQRTLRESGERLASIAKVQDKLVSEETRHAEARDAITRLTTDVETLRVETGSLAKAVENGAALESRLKAEISALAATQTETDAALAHAQREGAALKANAEAQLARIAELDQKARLLLEELRRTQNLQQSVERQNKDYEKETTILARKLAAAEETAQKRATQLAASEARHAEMNNKLVALARLGKEGQAQLQQEQRRIGDLEKILIEREKSLERVRTDARETAADLSRSLDKLRQDRDRMRQEISETRANSSALQRELNLMRKARQLSLQNSDQDNNQDSNLQGAKRAAE